MDLSRWKKLQIKITTLELDPLNPRIPALVDTPSQRDIVAHQGIVAQAFPFIPARLWLFLVFRVHAPASFPVTFLLSTKGPTKQFSTGNSLPLPHSRPTSKTS